LLRPPSELPGFRNLNEIEIKSEHFNYATWSGPNNHQKLIKPIVEIDYRFMLCKHFKLAKKHTTFNLKHDGKQPHRKFYIQKVWQEKSDFNS
jgi:hypothetical protein